MKLFLGADSNNVETVVPVVDTLRATGVDVEFINESVEHSLDYPDAAYLVCKRMQENAERLPARGVLVCGSGVGISIAANKIPGIRAAVIPNIATLEDAFFHDRINVACLGAKTTEVPVLKAICVAFANLRSQHSSTSKRVIEKLRKLDLREPL